MKFKRTKYTILLLISLIIILVAVFNHINSQNQKGKSSNNQISEFPPALNEKGIISNGIGVNVFGKPTEYEVMLMKEAGIKWVRIDLVWSNIEKEKGYYNFGDSGYDQFVNLLTKYGIRPYFILDYSNNLYEKNMSITTNEGRHAFAEFVRIAAQRYKNKGAIWEIWNEPNLPTYWKTQPSYKDYTLLVRHVAHGIKEYDPSGKVVAPALSGVTGSSLLWLEDTFKLGILNYIDAISVHPYRSTNPETVAQDYDVINALVSKYTKKSIPILSGEWGYSLKNTSNINQEELVQAQYLTRMLLVNSWKNIPISILYEWKNSGNDPNNIHDNYGIMWSENKPKISYYALKTFADVLNGYHLKERINIGQPDDYILKFKNNKGDIVLVFWTRDQEHYFPFKLSPGEGVLVSLLGNKQNIKWDEDYISLKMSQSPNYIEVK
ncbi:Cellulase (glycosyl hydrolase family 5) [Bacillus sp. OV166]|uniref:cellulase family glycosylhydrolase n=1 Tax=Bacillus sp. OV166 TaxID=1882763 RepID=UPI000A2AD7FC|nr:cellulase family glycosylhydrolase [Bacillus sp. OV166]SMQ85062.1 Cellulase (glycosyl hydrolase family 5) [Bacillus sp. OV166]